MELRDGKNDFFDTGTELIDTETFPDLVVLSFFWHNEEPGYCRRELC
jgi:hypothetical protein